jgi:glycosyltransferase involved in cell wall biosynthesis
MKLSHSLQIGVFTIASKNYLAYARVLLESVRRWNPGYRLFLCLVDRIDGVFDPSDECFELVEVEDIAIPGLTDMSIRYDIMELNTAVKPFMFQYLLDTTDLDSVIYLDPDIRVYAPLKHLERELAKGYSLILTPHICTPVEDEKTPSEYNMLQAGVFNLGFAAVSRSDEAKWFIKWWSSRLQTEAYADFSRNLFTDQRWCDLAPCFLERLLVFKAPGYNVAYWNLHERNVYQSGREWLVNGQPLVFFHFSGVNPEAESIISKHQNRYTWRDLPHLKALFDQYRDEVVAAGWEATRHWPYAFASSPGGIPLRPAMRKLYAESNPRPRFDLRTEFDRAILEACNLPALTGDNERNAITRLMHHIYLSRSDLQSVFDVRTQDGRRDFIEWFSSAASREYGFPDAVVVFQDLSVVITPTNPPPAHHALAQEQPQDLQNFRFDISLLRNIWSRLGYEGKLRLAPIITSSINRLIAQSYTRPEYQASTPALEISPKPSKDLNDRVRRLHGPASIDQHLGESYISALMHLIWLSRADLQRAFDLSTLSGQEAFIGWFAASASREYQLPSTIPQRARWNDRSSHTAQIHSMTLPGANLVGYAHAELGMGEHVRMSAAALDGTGVNYAVVNFNFGVASRQEAALDHGTLSADNPYVANLFHINADQMLFAYCQLGESFFAGRYNIGYWAWELAKCPLEWDPVMQVVDEVWAPSRFIQQAFSEKSDIPVIYMPLCVTLPHFDRLERRHLGLPDDAFIFLYTFDFFSFVDRKNPFAAIRAFKCAFPRGHEKTCLVLKVMNGDSQSAKWQQLLELTAGDPRIIVINRTMQRNEVLALFEASDCFVSLHRSEGFGRGPAEAMYLGKPVIVTNYSGNTDFTLVDNSCLVDYSLIPVLEGQYPFHQGQVWADVDIEHAAWHMRRLESNAALAHDIGAKGQAFVHRNFSRQAIGGRYTNRLRELKLA